MKGASAESRLRSLTWRGSCWCHNLLGTLQWPFWGKAGGWVWTNMRGRRLWGLQFYGALRALNSRNPTRFSQWRAKEDPLGALAWKGKEWWFWNILWESSITKAHDPGGRTSPEPYPAGEGHHPPSKPSGLTWGGKVMRWRRSQLRDPGLLNADLLIKLKNAFLLPHSITTRTGLQWEWVIMERAVKFRRSLEKSA